MSKKVKCTLCKFTDVEIPESIEVDEPYCEKCYEKTFGRAMMDHIVNDAEEQG